MTVTAWRCWRAEKRFDNLHFDIGTWAGLPLNLMYSIFVPFAWYGPTAQADGELRRDSSFHEPRGLHSLKKEHFHSMFLGNAIDHCFVVGQVELSGKCIEHEGGWLSERQTVLELHVPSPSYVQRYEELYQCDVYVMDDITDFFIPDESAYKIRDAEIKRWYDEHR